MTTIFHYKGHDGKHKHFVLCSILFLTVSAISILIISCAGHPQIKRLSEIQVNPEKFTRDYFLEGNTYFTSSWRGDKIDEFYIPNLEWVKKRFVLNIFAIEWEEIPNNWAEEILGEFCRQFEQIAGIKIEYVKGETVTGTLPNIAKKGWKFPYGINMSSIQYQYDEKGDKVINKKILDPKISDLKNIVEVQVFLPILGFDQEGTNRVISYLANVVFLDNDIYLSKRTGIPSMYTVLPDYQIYTGNDKEIQKIPTLNDVLIDELNIPQSEVKSLISDLRNTIQRAAANKTYTSAGGKTIKFSEHPEKDRLIDYDLEWDVLRLDFFTWVLSNRLVESKDSYLFNITGWTKMTTGERYKYATIEPVSILRSIYYDGSKYGFMFMTKDKCKEKFKKDNTGQSAPYGSNRWATTTKFPNWTFKGYSNSVSVLGKIHNIDEIDVNRAMGINDAFKLLAEKYKERIEWVRNEALNQATVPVYLPNLKYNVEPGIAIRHYNTATSQVSGVVGPNW